MECPSSPRMHAFVSGTLDELSREQLVTHLNECPDCYEWLTLLLATEGELDMEERTTPAESPQPAGASSAIFRRPLAVAAAVLLLLGLGWLARQSLQVTHPGVAESLRAVRFVQRFTEVPALPELNTGAASRPYSFSETDSSENQAFQTGRMLAYIAFLHSQDRPRELEWKIKALRESLPSSYSKAAEPILLKLVKSSAQGDLETGKASLARLERLFSESSHLIHLQLGVWVTLGQGAYRVRAWQYFSHGDIAFFIDGFSRQGEPPGLLKSLQGIREIGKSGTWSDDDWEIVREHLNNILLLFEL